MGTNLDILVIEDFYFIQKRSRQIIIKDYKNKFDLD